MSAFVWLLCFMTVNSSAGRDAAPFNPMNHGKCSTSLIILHTF